MITNTKIAWKWRSKCKEKERIVDLGPNNEQLTYLHFFVCSFARSFVRTFVRLYVRSFVCSFSRSMFVRLYCMINTSTRGKQHKKIAFPHARSVARAHTAHTQRRLPTPLAHKKNCRTLAWLRVRTRRTRDAACTCQELNKCNARCLNFTKFG